MVEFSPSLGIALALLLLIAVAAVRAASLPLGRAVLVASSRATLQLAAVSAILVVAFGSMSLTLAWVVGMTGVAAVTSAGRWGLRADLGRLRPAVMAVMPITAGAAPALVVILGSGVIPWAPASALPMAGILIGGAMTATSLAGRRMTDELASRAGEYAAALALGLPPRVAVLLVARQAAGLALLPAVDQTRTVGLVALPGAFVGVLLGGGSPVQAGLAQLLVLVGLLAAESVAVLVTMHVVARLPIPIGNLATM